VCVTVGMMTTGYDCEDILNLCLMRPIFSPTDFIQIKGRGTRRFSFSRIITDPRLKDDHRGTEKKTFKLFDFFANCEYFEEKYDYDEILKLPAITKEPGGNGPQPPKPVKEYETFDPDKIRELQEQLIGLQGMKIDRMFFEQFESRVREDEHVADNVRQGNWDVVLDYIQKNILNKPEEFYTLEKLRRAANVDRRLTLREIIEKVFGLIAGFKSKDVLLEEEFAKFVSDMKPENVDDLIALKYFFKAYATDHTVREIIENKRFGDLNVNPTFTMQDYKAVPRPWREVIPEYIKDYVPINQFM
jgi:type I restriction enzyme R subunit